MDGSVFSNYSWFELWGPFYLLAVVIVAYLYTKKIIKSPIYHVTRNQIQYFFSAIILFYIVKGTPYSIIADDFLFGAHVFQMAIIFFVVMPLFILSFPVEFLRRCFWHYRMKYAIGLFSHPWMTVILFNGLLSAYLIPPVFNTLKGNIILLSIAHIILAINAFLMWWTIITPVPEINKLENMIKIAYIFFASVLLFPIGFFLLVFQKAHYPVYELVAGDFIPVLTAIYDQQLAGGLLKITQLATYAYALLFIMLSWGRKEEEKEGQVDDENIRIVQGIAIHKRKKE